MKMKTVTVPLTEMHIRQGVRRSCAHCPVAEAMTDVGFIMPWVSCDSAVVGTGKAGQFRTQEQYTIRLPECVDVWITAYDKGDPVEPFTFDVRIPTDLQLR